MIKELAKWLYQNNFRKEAQQVDELQYAEPWHEEAVKEFGDEIEEPNDPLSSFVAPVSNPNIINEEEAPILDQILKDHEFYPIEAGGSGPTINSGTQGVIFRGVYQNKPTVAKVALYGNGNESLIWRKILEAETQMPAEYQKHIPQVYLLDQGRFIDLRGESSPYEIIIMEELFPLNSRMLTIINKSGKEYYNTVKNLLNDEEYMFKLSKKLVRVFPESNISATDLLKELFKQISQSNFKIMDKRLFMEAVKSMFRKAFNALGYSLEYNQYEELRYILDDYFKPMDLTPGGNLGVNRKVEVEPYWETNPETKQYFEVLKMLRDQFNVSWSDLWEKNIMMDRDGNLKIIDVGNYRVY